MLNETMKGYIRAISRKMLLGTLVVSCLIVIPGFVLHFASRDLVKPVLAAYSEEEGYAAEEEHAAEEVNPVILEWMKNKSSMPEHILSEIYRAAVNNINTDLILAICMVESNFNPNVQSEQGAIGLMGILPRVWLGELKAQGIIQKKEDLYQISHNIASGAYVLQKYLSKTRTLEKALLNYVGGDPDYARKVMKALGELYLAKWSRPEAA